MMSEQFVVSLFYSSNFLDDRFLIDNMITRGIIYVSSSNKPELDTLFDRQSRFRGSVGNSRIGIWLSIRI